MTVTPGVCRYCGCTEDHACLVGHPSCNPQPCSWVEPTRTVCSNPECIVKFAADIKRAKGGAA